MNSGIRVATPPPKPLMVFDGDCNFCTLWIRRWQQMTGDSVDYLPAQDPRIAAQFPEIPARTIRHRRPTHRNRRRGLFRRGSRISHAGAQSETAMAAARLRKLAGLCRHHRMGLPPGRRKPDIFLPADALVLGAARRTADAFSHALDFSARAGRDLPRRLRFAVDANQRPDWPQRHFAGRPVHVGGAATMRPAGHRPGPISSCCRRCAGSMHPTAF